MKLACTIVILLSIVALGQAAIDFSYCEATKRPSPAYINQVYNSSFLTNDYMTEVRKIFIETKTPNPLLVNKDTNVFVQFLSDNATIEINYILSITSSKNSFGYFLYDANTQTYKSSPGLVVIYPLLKDVVPAYGPVGCMYGGYSVTLGPYPAGTIMGFFIYVNAWQDTGALNTNAQKWFSMTSPLANSALRNSDGNKHVSWASVGGKTLFGFEDASMGDADYNDGTSYYSNYIPRS